MPSATPPVWSISGPSARTRISAPPGASDVRCTSMTVTGNVTMSVPRTTVRACPTIPGCTSESGRIGSAAAAGPAASRAPAVAAAAAAAAAARRGASPATPCAAAFGRTQNQVSRRPELARAASSR